MAVGRQDYQAGVVPIKSGYSLVQNPASLKGGGDIASGGSDDYCEYTPSAGFQFNVVAIRVFSALAFMNRMSVYIASTRVIYRYFDTENIDTFPEGYQLVVTAGKEFKITVENKDGVTARFDCSVYGFLEQIES